MEQEGSSSVGVVIRDSNGQVVAALCLPLQSYFSAELSEVFALEQGVLFAQELQLPRIIVESDALTVIQAVNDKATGSIFGHLIQGIHQVCESFESCHFKPSLQSKSSIQSNIIANGGEHLMKISLGTPAVEVLGIAYTGSDLTWTQCEPCEKCYKQNLPLFDPQQSSTYGNVPYNSSPCKALNTASCGTDKNTCQYGYSYGDQSFTNGDLGVETLTIGSTTSHQVTLPNIVFGCGHNNDGTFGEAGSGIIGLGGGPLSLVSQLNNSIGGKFSYCLVPIENSNVTSKINFGSNGLVSGNGVVSTPLVAKDPSTFYYLTLEGISVGNKRFAYKASSKAVASNEGNIVIDSDTTLTSLPPEFHEDLVSAVEKAIDAERVSDPRGVLSLCFRSRDEIHIPIITAHFTGADVKLKPINTFARMDDDLVCFTMIPSGSVAIFGNLAQINFLVG
ncbi:aspartic proteinase CDR1-like [Quercus robur]|uniref:aspartic proteinase CDR1-like n=1 Tax=Quercus robur TaxID=38942 RepID=UPI00216252E0|nr:aspartic proteinase CDR1-like [Quercus robur]